MEINLLLLHPFLFENRLENLELKQKEERVNILTHLFNYYPKVTK